MTHRFQSPRRLFSMSKIEPHREPIRVAATNTGASIHLGRRDHRAGFPAQQRGDVSPQTTHRNLGTCRSDRARPWAPHGARPGRRTRIARRSMTTLCAVGTHRTNSTRRTGRRRTGRDGCSLPHADGVRRQSAGPCLVVGTTPAERNTRRARRRVGSQATRARSGRPSGRRGARLRIRWQVGSSSSPTDLPPPSRRGVLPRRGLDEEPGNGPQTLGGASPGYG